MRDGLSEAGFLSSLACMVLYNVAGTLFKGPLYTSACDRDRDRDHRFLNPSSLVGEARGGCGK